MLGDGGGVGEVAGFALKYRHPIVIAFVGMAFEAKIAAGPGVLVVCRNNRHDLATVAGQCCPEGLPRHHQLRRRRRACRQSPYRRLGRCISRPRIANHPLDRRRLVEQPPRGDRGRKLRADPRRGYSRRRTDNETRSAPGDRRRRGRHGIAHGGAARGRARTGLRGDACHRRSARPGDTTCRRARHGSRRRRRHLGRAAYTSSPIPRSYRCSPASPPMQSLPAPNCCASAACSDRISAWRSLSEIGRPQFPATPPGTKFSSRPAARNLQRQPVEQGRTVRLRALDREQAKFGVDTARRGETADLAARRHHAMTRHDDRKQDFARAPGRRRAPDCGRRAARRFRRMTMSRPAEWRGRRRRRGD